MNNRLVTSVGTFPFSHRVVPYFMELRHPEIDVETVLSSLIRAFILLPVNSESFQHPMIYRVARADQRFMTQGICLH